LFKQYTKASHKDEIIWQINAIYAQDMPFVIVWYPYSFVNIKAWYVESAFWTGWFLYEYNWRNHLYNHVTLIKSKCLDFSKLLEFKSFVSYLMDKIELSFDSLSFDFFKWSNVDEDVQVNSWEVVGTGEIIEEPLTWDYELVQNYDNAWDPFAWLIQPM
jgi:hypothetical protein